MTQSSFQGRAILAIPALVAALLLVGCASGRGPMGEPQGLHAMPTDLARATPPALADPDRPAELAEAALHLLYPERAGGPDYAGAARLCLIAGETADPRLERDLQLACYRVATRSALRAGDRDLYAEAVGRWEDLAPRHERATGELAVHLAIRDRLNGSDPGTRGRLPSEIRRLIPTIENAR
ncbi:MAG: hypothetical protein JRG76_09270 [Deltaproteobacteria bacterium]|nr:hypothetical protein [Deltaproteobacteria bacterium]